MILFAHRGASADAPENTLAAFELALALGATGLESDVWLTADGIAVLDHDGFADPLGSVPIADVARADLPAHIPALGELYATCGSGFELSLDVKDPDAFDAVVEVARAAGASERLWCCHHRWRLLAGWRAAVPEVRLVDSTYVGFMAGGPERRFARLAEAGLDAVNLHHSEWDARRRALASQHGLAAFGWDAQDAPTLVRLTGLGLDGVFSDHVGLMVEVAGSSPP